MRKPEILVYHKANNEYDGIVRIPVKLPYEEINEALTGFIANTVLVDISGALEEVDRFQQYLIEAKRNMDRIEGEFLESMSNLTR